MPCPPRSFDAFALDRHFPPGVAPQPGLLRQQCYTLPQGSQLRFDRVSRDPPEAGGLFSRASGAVLLCSVWIMRFNHALDGTACKAGHDCVFASIPWATFTGHYSLTSSDHGTWTQVLLKPVCGEPGDLFQCSAFLKKVRGPGHYL